MFVTGAFRFSVAGFPTALDDGFAFGSAVLATGFGAALAVFAGAAFAIFALPVDLAATDFFTAGFAIDLLEAVLVAADFAFFAVTVVFAGFFIAFAMESIPTGIALIARMMTQVEPINVFWIRPRDVPENSRVS
ncbi:hypothetical protein [Noviherbaspirillum cavernae]|uniref:hypothetical protein n=1 Tax=Noviherbaspirillum cavernae TaxID=2320862 RepID=UPI001F5B30D3|nr:hypothetical protein [Noviherbaspirillum cavernae]